MPLHDADGARIFRERGAPAERAIDDEPPVARAPERVGRCELEVAAHPIHRAADFGEIAKRMRRAVGQLQFLDTIRCSSRRVEREPAPDEIDLSLACHCGKGAAHPLPDRGAHFGQHERRGSGVAEQLRSLGAVEKCDGLVECRCIARSMPLELGVLDQPGRPDHRFALECVRRGKPRGRRDADCGELLPATHRE